MKLAPIKWVENGFTIGYSGGKTVFCTGGIPGKEQKFTIEKETSHFIYARAESVESDCPAFPICGGCSYRHIPYSEELALKSKQIYDHLQVSQDVHFETIFSKPEGYRNSVQWKREGSKVGFYERFSNRLVDLKKWGCKNLHPILSPKLANGRDAFLNWRLSMTPSGEWEAIRYMEQETYLFWNGFQFQIPPSGFMQVNIYMIPKWAEVLQRILKKISKSQSRIQCVEFFCGSGFIGQILSPYITRLTGYEMNRESVRSAVKNANTNQITNYYYWEVDLYRKFNPSVKIHQKEVNLVILNPPRAGAGRYVLEAISEISPMHIIYSSCNLHTLTRDWKEWRKKNPGYTIDSVYLLDFFPRTKHFETLLHIVKNDFPG